MAANQKVELDSLYLSGLKSTDANPRIRSVVLDIRARYGAMRILGIGRGVKTLCYDLHHAGYTVSSMEAGESSATYPAELAPADRFCPPIVDSDSSPIKAASFDMAISIKHNESGSKPSALVKLAASNLQPGGIFILSMPYKSNMKNLLITVREWWNLPRSAVWDGGYIERWSKKCLIALLKSQGFSVVELIGIRGSSLQWDSLILVARKTGLLEPVSDNL